VGGGVKESRRSVALHSQESRKSLGIETSSYWETTSPRVVIRRTRQNRDREKDARC
jgi:hypothetical protein